MAVLLWFQSSYRPCTLQLQLGWCKQDDNLLASRKIALITSREGEVLSLSTSRSYSSGSVSSLLDREGAMPKGTVVSSWSPSRNGRKGMGGCRSPRPKTVGQGALIPVRTSHWIIVEFQHERIVVVGVWLLNDASTPPCLHDRKIYDLRTSW